MKRLVVALVLTIGLGGAAAAGYGLWPTVDATPAYRLAKVEQGPLVSSITATGSLNAVVTVDVSSQLSGQIAVLNADFNDLVKQGQVLARLDTAQVEARLAQARADLNSARATLTQQQAQRDKARADVATALAGLANAEAAVGRADLALRDADRELHRRQELRRRGVASETDLEKAQFANDTARSQMVSAEAQRRAAQAGLTSAEASAEVAGAQVQVAEAQVAQKDAAVLLVQVDLNRSSIRAPIDGVVVARSVNIGQTVASSLQAPTLYTIAQDLREMQVQASIDEADIGRVRVGQSVAFTVNAYPLEAFSGKVVQVRLAPKEDQNVVTYVVVIGAENADLRLLPGMTANLRITVEERGHVLKVPNAALRYRPPGAGAGAGGEAVAGVANTPASAGGGTGPGSAVAALSVFARTLREDLGLDEDRQREIERIVAGARDEFAAIGHGQGDPEKRRAEAQQVRQRVFDRIAAVLRPDQRPRFEELRVRAGTGNGRGSMRSVWVVGPNGLPMAIPVRLGISDGSYTEVISDALKPDQPIIVGSPPVAGGRAGSAPRPGF